MPAQISAKLLIIMVPLLAFFGEVAWLRPVGQGFLVDCVRTKSPQTRLFIHTHTHKVPQQRGASVGLSDVCIPDPRETTAEKKNQVSRQHYGLINPYMDSSTRSKVSRLVNREQKEENICVKWLPEAPHPTAATSSQFRSTSTSDRHYELVMVAHFRW